MTLEDIDDMDKEYSEESDKLEKFKWEVTIFAVIHGTHDKINSLADEDINNSRLILEKIITINELDRDKAYKRGFEINKEWIKELEEKYSDDYTVEMYRDEVLVNKKQ